MIKKDYLTRTELLTKMQVIADYDKMIDEIFDQIYKAADEQKRSIIYVFPNEATDVQIKEVLKDIGELGYTVNRYDNFGLYACDSVRAPLGSTTMSKKGIKICW